jgi:hypothetical protein
MGDPCRADLRVEALGRAQRARVRGSRGRGEEYQRALRGGREARSTKELLLRPRGCSRVEEPTDVVMPGRS